MLLHGSIIVVADHHAEGKGIEHVSGHPTGTRRHRLPTSGSLNMERLSSLE